MGYFKSEEEEIDVDLRFIQFDVKNAIIKLKKSLIAYENAKTIMGGYADYSYCRKKAPLQLMQICHENLDGIYEKLDYEVRKLLKDYAEFCLLERLNEDVALSLDDAVDIMSDFLDENKELIEVGCGGYLTYAAGEILLSNIPEVRGEGTAEAGSLGEVAEGDAEGDKDYGDANGVGIGDAGNVDGGENKGGKMSPIVKDIMKFFKSGEKDGENDIFGIVETRGENTQKHIMQPKKVKYKNRECDFYVYEPEVKEGNRIKNDKKQVEWENSKPGKYTVYYPKNIRAKKDGKLASINSNITVVEFLSQDKTGTNEAFFNLTGGFAMPIADKDYKGQTGSPIGLKKDFEVRERYTEIIGELDNPYNYAGKRTGKNDRLDEDTLDKVTDRFNGHVTSAMELSPNLKPEDHLLVVPITSGGGQVGVDVTTNYLRNRCLANEGVEGYEDYKDGPNTILLLEKEDAACQLTEKTKTKGFGELIVDSKGNETEIKYFDVAERTNMYITEHEELLKMAEVAGVNVVVVIITGTEDEIPISTGTRDGALELAEKYSDNVVAIQVPDSGHNAMINGKQTWVGAVTDYVADRVIHNNVIEEYGEDVYNQACEELKSQGKDLDNMTSDELASELRGTADKISK